MEVTRKNRKPQILLRQDSHFRYWRQVVQLCSNCSHDHQSQNICLENGTCKCTNVDGKELGRFDKRGNDFKKILSQNVLVDWSPSK